MAKQANSKSSDFNADERAKARESRNITIGDKVYRPQRRNRKVMREISELSAQVVGLKEDDPELAEKSLDVAYAQLEVLLREIESGEPPDPEFLEEELDYEDAGSLLTDILGGSDRPPTPASSAPATT